MKKYTQFPPNTKNTPSDPKSRLLPSNHFNIGDHLNHICYVRHYHSGHIIDVSARTGGRGVSQKRTGPDRGGGVGSAKCGQSPFSNDFHHTEYTKAYT